MAVREFKSEFGVSPLTPKEVGWLRGGEGQSLSILVPKARFQAVKAKVEALGLVDASSVMKKDVAIAAALHGVIERLEAIHQRMIDVPSHGHRAAGPQVMRQLEGLRAMTTGLPRLATLPCRRRHWEMLARISENGCLGTDGLNRSERNLLIKLTSAGWLKVMREGRHAWYRLSPAGVLALAQRPHPMGQAPFADSKVKHRKPRKPALTLPAEKPRSRPDEWQPIQYARPSMGQSLTHLLEEVHGLVPSTAAEHKHRRPR